MAWRFLKRTINRMFLTKNPIPPYKNHVVQIGDPILRNKSSPIPVDVIKSEEVQNVRILGKHFLIKILF
jgi:hypothetical protein